MPYRITRFTRSERWFHNIVMVTFTTLLVTGLGMFYYNVMGDQGAERHLLVLVHKILAVSFISGPILAFLMGRRRIWMENAKLLLSWSRSDVQWLLKKPFQAIFRNIQLPKDDKFNPGQKVWAAIAISGSLAMVVSGIFMWITNAHIIALIVHSALAIGMLFALLGHAFMALVNPDTRPGLGSIVDGTVDAAWARSHHPLWVDRKTLPRRRATARRRTGRVSPLLLRAFGLWKTGGAQRDGLLKKRIHHHKTINHDA